MLYLFPRFRPAVSGDPSGSSRLIPERFPTSNKRPRSPCSGERGGQPSGTLYFWEILEFLSIPLSSIHS